MIERDRRIIEHGREDGLNDGYNETTMHDKLTERRGALVAVATVHEDEPRHVTKLRNAEIGCKRRLHALLALDAYADVRRLDHAHIVTTVADGTNATLGVLLEQVYHLRLLRGRAAAHHHGRAVEYNLDKLLLVELEHDLERLAQDDEGRVHFAAKVVDLVARVVSILHLPERVDVLVARHQLRALGNARGRLELVAREHPDLDASVAQRLERFAHLALQLVLDTCETQEFEVLLESLDYVLDLLTAILEVKFGFVKSLLQKTNITVLFFRVLCFWHLPQSRHRIQA